MSGSVGEGDELMRELLQDEGLNPSSFISIGRNQLMRQLQRRDKFRLVSDEDVQKKADELEQTGELKSDDRMIVRMISHYRISHGRKRIKSN